MRNRQWAIKDCCRSDQRLEQFNIQSWENESLLRRICFLSLSWPSLLFSAWWCRVHLDTDRLSSTYQQNTRLNVWHINTCPIRNHSVFLAGSMLRFLQWLDVLDQEKVNSRSNTDWRSKQDGEHRPRSSIQIHRSNILDFFHAENHINRKEIDDFNEKLALHTSNEFFFLRSTLNFTQQSIVWWITFLVSGVIFRLVGRFDSTASNIYSTSTENRKCSMPNLMSFGRSRVNRSMHSNIFRLIFREDRPIKSFSWWNFFMNWFSNRSRMIF